MREVFIDLSKYFRPHPAQDYIMKSRADWIVLECARRFGKGRAAVFWLIWNYMELMSKPRPASLVPVVHINVFVPSLGSISVPWLELKKFIPNELIVNINEAEKTIHLLGGGLIEVKSADIRAIQQGVGLDLLWITEADKIERSVWHDIIPMLRSQWRAGKAWIESKPYQEIGWFHELYSKGLTPTKQLESFHFTTLANPFIDWDDVEFDREIMGEIDWKKEYMAEVEAGSEAAFPHWKKRLLPIDFVTPKPDPTHFYQIGVDLGKQLDYTTIAAFDMNMRMVPEVVRFQTSWDECRKRIADFSRRYNTNGTPSPVYVDVTGKGEPVMEDLRREYVDVPLYDVVISQSERFHVLSRLALAIEKGDIQYPDWTPLKQELSLMKRIHRAPMDQFKMPAGKHDDLIFALALAYNKEKIDLALPSYTRSTLDTK